MGLFSTFLKSGPSTPTAPRESLESQIRARRKAAAAQQLAQRRSSDSSIASTSSSSASSTTGGQEGSTAFDAGLLDGFEDLARCVLLSPPSSSSSLTDSRSNSDCTTFVSWPTNESLPAYSGPPPAYQPRRVVRGASAISGSSQHRDYMAIHAQLVERGRSCC